jgi:parallel beta-helix repeat protein
MVFSVLLLAAPVTVSAADYYVDDDTCPATGSGSQADPFCTIQTAVNQASAGDSIHVYSGSYAEEVNMKSGVSLYNVPGEQPKIVTARSSQHNMVVFDRVSNCTLEGFVLDDSNRTSRQGFALVTVSGSSTSPAEELVIRNCTIRGMEEPHDPLSRAGIRINGKVSIRILDSLITRNGYAGIVTRPRQEDVIYDSTIIIQGCRITENGISGIYLRGSGTGNQVFLGGDDGMGNEVSRNGNWSVDGTGIRLETLQGVVIENNQVFGNGRAGMLLDSVDTVSPHVSRNSIFDNFAAGINIGGASTLTIGDGNDISSNGTAGIAFYVHENPYISWGTYTASSAPVTISGNSIHDNARAAVAVIDHVNGPLTITGNTIYANEKAGIAFVNACTAVVEDNVIRDHSGAAGIFTGTWQGTNPPDPTALPLIMSYNRANGPVNLTIRRNRVYNNYAGMRLDHASGTISNNLVYSNTRSGIRFSGNDVSPYEPFDISWGISALTNNTVTDNGSVIDGTRRGGGIVYDDITVTTNDDGTERLFDAWPLYNGELGTRFIQNNILAYNTTAGVRDAYCQVERDYNNYYFNYGYETLTHAQVGGCFSLNPNESIADPKFVDRTGEDFHLQTDSPAKNSGNDGTEMGAYGGSDPLAL